MPDDRPLEMNGGERGGNGAEVRGVGQRAGESAPTRVGDRERKKERAREGRKKVNSVCVL